MPFTGGRKEMRLTLHRERGAEREVMLRYERGLQMTLNRHGTTFSTHSISIGNVNKYD